MVESVCEVVRQGVRAYATTPRAQWVLQWPGQVVLVVTAVFWTAATTAAITGPAGSLAEAAAKNTAQLAEIVELVGVAGGGLGGLGQLELRGLDAG